MLMQATVEDLVAAGRINTSFRVRYSKDHEGGDGSEMEATYAGTLGGEPELIGTVRLDRWHFQWEEGRGGARRRGVDDQWTGTSRICWDEWVIGPGRAVEGSRVRVHQHGTRGRQRSHGSGRQR